MKKLIVVSSVVIVLSTVAIVYTLLRNPVPIGSEVTWRDGVGTCITERIELYRMKDGKAAMGYRLRVKDARAHGGEYIVGIPEKYILNVK